MQLARGVGARVPCDRATVQATVRPIRNDGRLQSLFFWKAYLSIEGTLNGNRPS